MAIFSYNENVYDFKTSKAGAGRIRTAKWTSLTHLKRQITEEKKRNYRLGMLKRPRNEKDGKAAFISLP